MKFTIEQAAEVAEKIGIDFDKKDYTIEEFTFGMNVELEHGTVDPATNVTNDDPIVTGKIALAHLNEVPKYYNDKIGVEAWERLLEHLPAGAAYSGVKII
jgi:hypothetical protein